MINYIGKRLLALIPVLLIIIFLVFGMQYLAPGNPALLQLGPSATEEEVYKWNEEYHLNDPFLVQFGKYVSGIVTKADFGKSYRTGKSVTDEIFARWPVTFVLTMLTEIAAFIIGLVAGTIAALNRNTWKDNVVRVAGILGTSMPNFWFALLLILLFSVNLGWFPVSGWYGPRYWILPALTAGIIGASSYMRNIRSAVLDNTKQDYVTTARAKGQKESYVIGHHIMGNAMIPIITSVGLHFAKGLGGNRVIEQIFAIPGLGRYMVEAINNRDYPQLRGAIVLMAITVTFLSEYLCLNDL